MLSVPEAKVPRIFRGTLNGRRRHSLPFKRSLEQRYLRFVINAAAKQASANVKSIQKEIDVVIRKGQQATKEQLAALKTAQQVEAKIKTIQRRQAREERGGFIGGAQAIRGSRGSLRDARGTLELLQGDVNLGNIKDAIETGAEAAHAAKATKVAKFLEKAAAGVAAVSAVAIYAKFAYDLVNEQFEAARDHVKAVKQSEKAFEQSFGKGNTAAYHNIKRLFQRYEGGNVAGSEAAIKQEQELQKYAGDAGKLLDNSGLAMFYLRKQAKDELERAGLAIEDVHGKFGLAAQLSSDRGNALERAQVVKDVLALVEAQRAREAAQKEREERIKEMDPSYEVRMRNRDTYLKGVERDQMMAHQDWTTY